MKKVAFIIAMVASLILTACKESAVVSPQIIVEKILVNGQKVSTDEIHVHDTVQIYMLLQPYYDQIEYFNVSMDRTFLRDSTFSDKDFATLCDETASKRAEGHYVFKGLKNGDAIYLSPAKIIADKCPGSSTNELTVEYSLKSTANVKSEYNPTYKKITFKVLEEETK